MAWESGSSLEANPRSPIAGNLRGSYQPFRRFSRPGASPGSVSIEKTSFVSGLTLKLSATGRPGIQMISPPDRKTGRRSLSGRGIPLALRISLSFFLPGAPSGR